MIQKKTTFFTLEYISDNKVLFDESNTTHESKRKNKRSHPLI